eukprot:TRINITY_DN2938_c0_g1_i1.p1 TRINITY_DN2938_c0_g1~~TRINITY_DN2938_c0_g1_i1.p1  ORF type:complete len:424 (-),score=62.62 TRINITY_DN2938_c0_g1_i1:169-1440(-)
MNNRDSDACNGYGRLDGGPEEQDLEADKTPAVGERCCTPDRTNVKLGSAVIFSVAIVAVVMHFSSSMRSSDTNGNGTSADPTVLKRDFRLLSAKKAEKMLLASFDKDGPVCADKASLVSQLTVSTNIAILKVREALMGSGYSADDAPLRDVEPGQLSAARLGHEANWLVPEDDHPNVFKICLTGGVCGGKTAALNGMRAALEKTWQDEVFVFSVPEMSSVLLGLGAMNFGAYKPFVEAEHLEFASQLVVLQLVYEDIFTRYAECITAGNSSIRAKIAITDRDALSNMAFSRPIVPNAPESWEKILQHSRELLAEPRLSTAMLQGRYIGAVVLQSLAVMDGKLNEAQYDKICRGAGGTNPLRAQNAIEAKLNDEQCEQAYREAYPRSKLCLVPNTAFDFAAKLKSAVECAVDLARSAMHDALPQ